MKEQFVLVDFENVHELDLKRLSAHAQAVKARLRRLGKNEWPKRHAMPANCLATHFHRKQIAEKIMQTIEHLLEAGLVASMEAAETHDF